MGTAFRVMKRFKGLRGGAFDFAGKTEERRQERQLIEDYVGQLDRLVATLAPDNHACAVAVASIPDEIRGYGDVKQASIEAAKAAERMLLEAEPALAREVFAKPVAVAPRLDSSGR